jgi:outer membrane protein
MKRIIIGLAAGLAWTSVAFADTTKTDAKPASTPTSTTTTTSASASDSSPSPATAAAATPAEQPQKTEGPKDHGMSLGIRTGFGLPLGEAAANAALNKTFSGQIPAMVDAGYRINPNIYVGGYFGYGFGLVSSDTCASGASCSASVMRFGANVHYHFLPNESFDPWVGLGVGYEKMSFSAEAGGAKTEGGYHGFEFANLQAGADFKATPAMRIGPFVSFSLSQYSTADVTVPGSSLKFQGSIADKSFHEWLLLGVRGQYDL